MIVRNAFNCHRGNDGNIYVMKAVVARGVFLLKSLS